MKPKATLRRFLALAGSLMMAVSSAHAATLYWDVNGTTDGFSTVVGTWGTNLWNTDATGGAGGTTTSATTSSDDLIIAQATTNTGTIGANITASASSLTFAPNVGPTATISGGGSLTIGGTGAKNGIFQESSGANTINLVGALRLKSDITAFNFSNSSSGLLTIGAVTGLATSGTQTITVGSSSTGGITLNGLISNGAGGNVALNINSSGAGITYLSGNNNRTFSGGVTLTAGTLRVNGNNGALGAGTLTLNGGILDLADATSRNFGRNTTVGANAKIISQRTDAAAGAGVTHTLGTLSIGANTLTVEGGTVNSGTAGVTFGATTLSGNAIFDVINPAGGGGTTLTLGAITGGFGITKSGSGTLALTGASDYSGSTAIDVGTLNIQHATALGTTAGGTSVASGATLSIQNGIAVGAEALSLNGTGVSNGGALRNISGTNSYAGLITLAGATRINSDAGTLTLDVASGDVITGTYDLTFGGAGNISVSDAINIGSATLTKDGAGTLTLSSTNNYTGGTTLSTGALALGHANALLNTGTITFNGGGIQSSDATSLTISNVVAFTGNATIGGTGNMTFSDTGTIALGGTRQITVSTSGTQATFAQAFSGSTFGITKAGAGTLELTAANTYSGTTTVSAGTLILSGSNNSAGATTVSGGTLQLNNNSNGGLASGTFTVGVGTVQSLNADRTIAQGISLTGNPTFSGDYSITSNGQMNGNTGARIVTNNIASGKTLTFAGYNRGSNNYAFTIQGTGTTIVNGSITTGSIGGALIKSGAGTLVLNGPAGVIPAGLTLSQGIVIFRQSMGFGGNGTTSIAVGAALNYVAATDTSLSLEGADSGALTINGGTGGEFEGSDFATIGGSIGNSATSARIIAGGNILVPTPDVKVNVYGVAGVNRPAGTTNYTLLTGGSGGATSLNDGNYSLGTVFNNTDFTVGAITKSTTSLFIDLTKATALSGNVSWKGGLTGNTGVWAASNGTTQSNWQVTDGVDQALAPGATADLVFSTGTSPGTMAAMTLGADVSVRTLTVNNTATAYGLNNDGFKLTITPGSSTAGITIGSGVQASTIASSVGLGAAQTWTNNSANALTVSGVISGANNLTTAGTGKVILSGVNTFTGTTTVSAGTLLVSGSLVSDVTVSDGATLGGGGTVDLLAFGGGSFFDIFEAYNNTDSLTASTISFASTGFGIDNLVYNGSAVNWASISNGTYTLITGTLDETNLENFGIGSAYLFGDGRGAYFQEGSLQLVVAAIPEPHVALLGGLGVLLLLRRRRR